MPKVTLCALSKSDLVKKILSKPLKKNVKVTILHLSLNAFKPKPVKKPPKNPKSLKTKGKIDQKERKTPQFGAAANPQLAFAAGQWCVAITYVLG